jgi:hypothetical protein
MEWVTRTTKQILGKGEISMRRRRPEIEVLEDYLDDIPLSRWDLEVPIDLAREELANDDALSDGFRALYENPEAILDRH